MLRVEIRQSGASHSGLGLNQDLVRAILRFGRGSIGKRCRQRRPKGQRQDQKPPGNNTHPET